ncbi:hypothetical protein AURDEDRAFT_54220 [Auricularia subglabra TFB-10046 SS5]|nr:hypothetical protein AURDEDRAFT_54220 [Auricularia subglabra TFB-10046 SS5]
MWSALLAFALAASQANALLRFPCSQLTVLRSDPLVNPGTAGAHLHQVIGGSQFDFQMASNIDMQAAKCSTCSIKENKSNYWTPTLYFQSPTNGTFKRINQRLNPRTTVYYIQIGSGIKAFPKGFRMLAGDPFLRSYNSSVDDSRSITFRCLQSNDASGTGQDTNGMPSVNCPGGVRTQINFPTCWDGKNVDSANHRSHVSYAIGASFGNFGQGCPSTHPVQIPLLFLETYWDTAPYANEWRNGKSPFVWAMGDPTGYGYHADYMMGWPESTLQQAMDRCTDAGGLISSCPVLTSRSEQEMNDCAIPARIDEPVNGWLTKLPGCNEIQAGPGRATPQTGCGAPTEMLPESKVSFLKSITGWQAVGCASAGPTGGQTTTGGGMTIEKCLNTCANAKMQYAGLRNRNQCICGNAFNAGTVNANYACNLQCEGDLEGASGFSGVTDSGLTGLVQRTAVPRTALRSTTAGRPSRSRRRRP